LIFVWVSDGFPLSCPLTSTFFGVEHSKPVGPTGNLTILPDVDKEQLRHVIGSYYTKFPLSQCTDYTVSKALYFNFWFLSEFPMDSHYHVH
jgi:hypothetical protein